MEPKRPILWHQGLFLQPHHFQYLEDYIKDFYTPFIRYRVNDLWGVVKADINLDSLNEFVFELNKGEFIFKDGSWVVFPGNSILKSRSFKEEWFDVDKPFFVYLGLKKLSKDAKNVFLIKNNEDIPREISVRFVCPENGEQVPDLYDPSSPLGNIKKMSYVLKIFWENEIQELSDYEIIPLAKLIRDSGNIKVAQDFVYPCINLASSNVILELFKGVKDQITSRCKQLEEFKNPVRGKGSNIDAQYLMYFYALRTLNRYVPLFHSFFEQPDKISPRDAYVLMSQLIGELSCFTERINGLSETEKGMRLLPKFNHEDPYSCFFEANRLIWELLNEIIIGPEYIIQLRKEEIGWVAELPPESLDRRNNFYLIMNTEEDITYLLEAAKNLIKVCSLECVNTLIARALPGIPLEYVDSPLAGIPRKEGSNYFRIDRENPLWEHVMGEKNIVVVWDDAPEDLKMNIVVLKQ